MLSGQVDSRDICEAPVYSFSTGKRFLSWEQTNAVKALNQQTLSGFFLQIDQNLQDVVSCLRHHTTIKK
jgi:hypothetical protein